MLILPAWSQIAAQHPLTETCWLTDCRIFRAKRHARLSDTVLGQLFCLACASSTVNSQGEIGIANKQVNFQRDWRLAGWLACEPLSSR